MCRAPPIPFNTKRLLKLENFFGFSSVDKMSRGFPYSYLVKIPLTKLIGMLLHVTEISFSPEFLRGNGLLLENIKLCITNYIRPTVATRFLRKM